MNETNYWLSPTVGDGYDSYYEAYRVVGEEMEDNFGKVLVAQKEEQYVVIIERDDIGRKEFQSTSDKEEVSVLTKVAASSLTQA